MEVQFKNKTELRWWMAAGAHTDETIKAELDAMHSAGFCGVELCQLNDSTLDSSVYGYGGAQWEHDLKLILEYATDLGMSVSITSGTSWSTANVPGLDPDSQAANQCIVMVSEDMPAGKTRTGAVLKSDDLRKAARFIGAYAVKKSGAQYEAEGIINLTPLIKDGMLEYTAPYECTVMYYYTQGTADERKPSVIPAYTVNYFDRRGFLALSDHLGKTVLGDKRINGIIRSGDVQLFMDSLEYTSGKGMTAWTEDFAQKFKARKGYDVLPFMFLTKNAPCDSVWGWYDNADLIGSMTLTDISLNKKILNDIFDIQTELYMSEFMLPFKEWLGSYGIRLRAQISYGKNLELSEPIAVVDYPEAENRNQKNQIDMYRLWSGGAHLQNKILSSETGGLDHSAYSYTYQMHLQEAYKLYAAGYSRIIWHIWASEYGPTPRWPGYEGGDRMDKYYKFGLREPSYTEYGEFNDHLGRIQQILRRGRAGVDIGMLYTRYGQHMLHRDARDWMAEHEPMFFPSTSLEDKGFTYDYFAPDLLKADGVYFDKNTKTLEMAGYKALVLWQDCLCTDGARAVLGLAKEGLPIVVVDGAAAHSPYANDDGLCDITDKLKTLANVKSVRDAAAVADALCALGVSPYIGSARGVFTQVRRDGDKRYVYVYNYRADKEVTLLAEGRWHPHIIDPWTGKSCLASDYAYKGGKTEFKITLAQGDVALIALEREVCAPMQEKLQVSDRFDITDWQLTVESWEPSDTLLTRTETVCGVNTKEYAYGTKKTMINTTLDTLKTWDEIECVGKNVSGKGVYKADFDISGGARRVYIDFGKLTQSMRVFINGKKTDNINMITPCVDISSLVVSGKNTIEICYSSNLCNLQLSRGIIKEGVLPSNFVGYETGFLSYGVQEATVITYK